MKIVLTIIYLIFTCGGLFFMKMGGDSLSLTLSKGIAFKIGGLTLVGFILYICSFLLWQRLVVAFDLSYIVPITTGIVQVIVLLISFFIFKENLSLINIIGVIFVIVGIVLISFNRIN